MDKINDKIEKIQYDISAGFLTILSPHIINPANHIKLTNKFIKFTDALRISFVFLAHILFIYFSLSLIGKYFFAMYFLLMFLIKKLCGCYSA